MTNEELLAVAEIVEKLTNRYRDQEAAHKAALTEIRASFNASTSADEKIIEWLRIKVQDARAERDALRAEVAALQERLRASIARGDFAQMEVARLKPQIPKHPVKVGEWVRRLVPSPSYDVGTVAKVVHVDDDTSDIQYTVTLIDGRHGDWFAENCEPCDPPIVKREPTIGDTVRLVTHPERAQVAKHLRTALQWPWMPSWGLVGQTGKVVKPLVAVAEAVAVALDGSTIFARWPIACLEVVSEATHDTEAGKAAAESAVRTEPVAEEIKVGDLVEVFQAIGSMTDAEDIGCGGVVRKVDGFFVWLNRTDTMGLPREGIASLGDVRKVTT